jgi:hypothetical protein
MTKNTCECCEEDLPAGEDVPFFGDMGFCGLDCIAIWGDTVGRPIHREMLDWKEVTP